MTHKEFYIWLDGYLAGRLDSNIVDVNLIVEKMKEVKGELDFNIEKYKGHKSTYPFNPINPIIGGVNDDLGYPPKIVM